MKTSIDSSRTRRDQSEAQRWLALAGGVAALALGLRRHPVLRLVLGTAAGGLLYRGLTGRNPMRALTPLLHSGAAVNHLVASGNVVIARTPRELYDFWRNFENLPTFMRHLESVQVVDAQHSRWRARAPAGTSVAWDAEVTRDIVGQEIAWRALPGADVENWGSVRFRQVIDGRGTEVQVRLNYRPPAGKLGAIVAALFGEEPQVQLEDDLARLRQLLEAGALPDAAGVGAGSVAGATAHAVAGTAQSPGRVPQPARS